MPYPPPPPHKSARLTKHVPSTTTSKNPGDVWIDYHVLHMNDGHTLILLADATWPPVFDVVGVWALMEDLRHGRRPINEQEDRRLAEKYPGSGCRCTGCAAEACEARNYIPPRCSLKRKLSKNYCYACSPENSEGCEYLYYMARSNQVCNKGVQGIDAVGRYTCWRHARDLGLEVGTKLTRASDNLPIPRLLMVEVRPSLPTLVRRCGVGVRDVAEVWIEALATHMRTLFEDDRPFTQKISIRFIDGHVPYIKYMGARRYAP